MEAGGEGRGRDGAEGGGALAEAGGEGGVIEGDLGELEGVEAVGLGTGTGGGEVGGEAEAGEGGAGGGVGGVVDGEALPAALGETHPLAFGGEEDAEFVVGEGGVLGL